MDERAPQIATSERIIGIAGEGPAIEALGEGETAGHVHQRTHLAERHGVGGRELDRRLELTLREIVIAALASDASVVYALYGEPRIIVGESYKDST